MSNDEDQKQKKAQNRDQALGEKIELYSKVSVEFRQSSLRANYTQQRVKRKFGLVGWMLILTQVSSLLFFSTLFVFSYIPQTKKIVAMVMP